MNRNSELELAFYEQFFLKQGLEPYPVQERALDLIFDGKSVLVTVPTGTGKTLLAKAALFQALSRGERAIYATPLRALTEEKYRELCDDFGNDNVGFATGDYTINPNAKIRVVVAEILWNQIFSDRRGPPAEVIVLDEGHYFNDPERGYVWEQSILGLHARAQLVVLSATVGNPEAFCQWVNLTRRVEMHLVRTDERRVPLHHEFREATLLETVRDLFRKGDYPCIVFGFSREQCFERARLLKSHPRFVTDEERAQIQAAMSPVLSSRGSSREIASMLLHGIGIHHAGILPRYKQLVEALTAERLLKFVVSTETISAGINLPARCVVFPELKKWAGGEVRLLTPAEYHQMSGRAGRPQFDNEGFAISLAPEAIVQEIRHETEELTRRRRTANLQKIRQSVYARARAEAQRVGDIIWDEQAHQKLVSGSPAPLRSQTKITADQVLGIGLAHPEDQLLPPEERPLDIATVIDRLMLSDRERQEARNRLVMVVDNLRSLGVLDEQGHVVKGALIADMRGVDALFVYFCLGHHDLAYEEQRELVEYLVEEEVVSKVLRRKDDDKKRQWIGNRMRQERRDGNHLSWEDVAELYERENQRELAPVEVLHAEFLAKLPHPELHGGKTVKSIFATIETEEMTFFDFIEQHGLEHQEGHLFSYLARLGRVTKMLGQVTKLPEYEAIEGHIRNILGVIDDRVLT